MTDRQAGNWYMLRFLLRNLSCMLIQLMEHIMKLLWWEVIAVVFVGLYTGSPDSLNRQRYTSRHPQQRSALLERGFVQLLLLEWYLLYSSLNVSNGLDYCYCTSLWHLYCDLSLPLVLVVQNQLFPVAKFNSGGAMHNNDISSDLLLLFPFLCL